MRQVARHSQRIMSYLGLLGLALFLSLSFAQDTDPILQSYGVAFENLNEATASYSADSQQSLEALSDAAQMLRPLSGSNSNVIAALERTFERARTSVQNQSATDLAVQVSVLKGGFWRLVYESAIKASEAGDIGTARLRLARLAQDMSLTDDVIGSVNTSTQVLDMLRGLERGAAGRMKDISSSVRTSISEVESLSEVKDNTYKQLADAYSLYLPMQDSPRLPDLGQFFTPSFSALVNDQKDLVLDNLLQLDDVLASVIVNSAASTPTAIEASNPAAVAAVTTDAALAATPVVAPAEAGVNTNVDTIAATSPVANTPVSTAAQVAVPAAAPVAASTLDTTALKRQLQRLGLSNTQQDSLATLYAEEQLVSVNDALDKLYADSSKIVVAMSQGDQARAKSLIAAQEANYNQFIAPILNQTNPRFNQKSQSLYQRLSSTPALRLQDSVMLAEHIDSAASVIASNPVPSLSASEINTNLIWMGWLRAILTILLGIAAFVPLYFLYLAFSGGNRNWQLVGWALFALLLPLMYEGLSYTLGLISSVAGGISILDAPSRFSIFQSTFGQILWVIVSGAAITLASLGLYGICVQFGLLGVTKSTTETGVNESAAQTSATSFDWDEEF